MRLNVCRLVLLVFYFVIVIISLYYIKSEGSRINFRSVSMGENQHAVQKLSPATVSRYTKKIQNKIEQVSCLGIDAFATEVLGLEDKQIVVDAIREYILVMEAKLNNIHALDGKKKNSNPTDQIEVEAVDYTDHRIKHPKLLSIIDMLHTTKNRRWVCSNFGLSEKQLRLKVKKYGDIMNELKEMVKGWPKTSPRKEDSNTKKKKTQSKEEEEERRNPIGNMKKLKGVLICFMCIIIPVFFVMISKYILFI